jgi:two-component system copper resistance phosphate regulon response regulator CusR
MTDVRILVVEDDPMLGAHVADSLRVAGFAVDVAADLADADLKVSVNQYDCLVVDRGLPDGDGLNLVAAQRELGLRTPVLMLTARDQVADRLDGFSHGADDYLAKPFIMAELTARTRALCRRRETPTPPRIVIADLVIDLPRRRVQRGGVLLSLTPKEFAVLELLAIRASTVVTRTEVIESCWDEMADPVSNVVDAVVAGLRRKLGPPPLLETVRGVGFTIAP